MFRSSILTILLLSGTAVYADAIKVGSDVYNDVYITSDDQNYYIRIPEEGRIEKVSKKRVDVVGPRIEPDESVRNKLLEQFEEKKAEVDAEAEMELAEAEKPTDLDTASIKETQQLEAQALFDAQLAYWKSLSEEERTQIVENLLTYDEAERESYAIVKGDVISDIAQLETQKSEHEARMRELEERRQQLVAEAVENNAADRFMIEYEAAIRGDQLAHQVEVSAIESTIQNRERDAAAVQANDATSAARTGTFLARIEELNQALEAGYEPEIETDTVGTWNGAESKTTDPFEIDAPLWRLDVKRDDLGAAGTFSITVFDAETDKPFTRVSDVDFLQMRARVLDGPGKYYLKIEQSDSDIPYEISAVEISEDTSDESTTEESAEGTAELAAEPSEATPPEALEESTTTVE